MYRSGQCVYHALVNLRTYHCFMSIPDGLPVLMYIHVTVTCIYIYYIYHVTCIYIHVLYMYINIRRAEYNGNDTE